MKWKIAVLTASDKAARGLRRDESAQVIRELMEEHDLGTIVDYRVIPDEIERISSALLEMADHLSTDLILTTGGTGLGPRDVTPEATRLVIHREVPGLADKMRIDSMQKTPMAALSRGMAGLRGKTLIINLPGSPKGVQENLLSIIGILPHALETMTGVFTEHVLEERKGNG